MLSNSNHENGTSFMMLFFAWIAIVIFLFFTRPNSLRRLSNRSQSKREGPNTVKKEIDLFFLLFFFQIVY